MTTLKQKNLVNGQLADQVSVLDRGLRYGDGCFETMAVQGGRVRLWHRHYERLMNGCERLGIQPDFDRAVLERELGTLIGGTDQAIVRLTVTRGCSGKGYAYPEQQYPTRILSILPYPGHPAIYREEGVTVRLCKTTLGRNPVLAGIKHLNRLEQVLARSEWNDEFAEGLLCDEQGHVIEGTITNVFIVEDGKVYTPNLDSCGVAGVMRAELLDRMKHLGIDAHEVEINRERLLAAHECFLTNAVVGIWPVNKIENKPFHVGEITRSLIAQIDADQGYSNEHSR